MLKLIGSIYNSVKPRYKLLNDTSVRFEASRVFITVVEASIVFITVFEASMVFITVFEASMVFITVF